MTPDLHPEELLGRYPDLADDAERAQVEAHLATCERCRRLLAHLERVGQAGGDLGRPPLTTAPSPDLVARAKARMARADEEEGQVVRGPWRRLGVVVVPLAVAAAAVLALVLRPDPTPDPDDPSRDPGYGVKGDDDSAEDLSDLELQLVLPVDGEARLLFPGDDVPGGANLLLGAVLAEGLTGSVVLDGGGARRVVWTGRGNATTDGGGALFAGDEPVTVAAPETGPFTLELWLGDDPDAPDARPRHEFPLDAVSK